MEADLARFYGIDYRDRWRTPRLTLRRLMVLLLHVPPESALGELGRGGKAHWSVEADLARFYGIDYRDRWRTPRLTLRRLMVLLLHVPPESALGELGREGKAHWSVEAHLLDDLRIATTTTKKNPAKPHPSRPKPRQRVDSPERRRKIAAARHRAAERRRRLEGGTT